MLHQNKMDLKLTIPEVFYTWINISAVYMNHLDLKMFVAAKF